LTQSSQVNSLLLISEQIGKLSQQEIMVQNAVTNNFQLAVQVVDYELALNFKTAAIEPKVFQMTKKDPEMTLKTICAVIAMFNASINVTTERMKAIDIYSLATKYMTTYTHDSVADLILCLKRAKGGIYGKIYNRVDQSTIMEYIVAYMEEKAMNSEMNYLGSKDECRTEAESMLIGRQNQAKRKSYNLEPEQNERLRTAKEAYEKAIKQIAK
jgi:hypothetical protein